MQKSASKRDRTYKYYHRQLCRCSVILFALTGVFLGGCGDFDSGYYFVSSGDLVGAAGGESTVAFRLMREEILFISSTVEDNEVVVELEGSPLRAAVTDDDGYASVKVKLPENAGKYDLTLSFQDKRGLNASKKRDCWVFDTSREILIVDVASALSEPERYKQVLDNAISSGSQIGYEYRCRVGDLGKFDNDVMHKSIIEAGLPDAAVLPFAENMIKAVPPYVHFLSDNNYVSGENSELSGISFYKPGTEAIVP